MTSAQGCGGGGGVTPNPRHPATIITVPSPSIPLSGIITQTASPGGGGSDCQFKRRLQPILSTYASRRVPLLCCGAHYQCVDHPTATGCDMGRAGDRGDVSAAQYDSTDSARSCVIAQLMDDGLSVLRLIAVLHLG
ncbi:unnamed protein product [Schistocephalus solidus]|uniref:Uncharacterized protein n=1 Tax=Schistocephalus solidus TaxID=70667 RepID=A0A183SDL7_SCHSO|nr:unnamed protein product [Schistocephalus solidus]